MLPGYLVELEKLAGSALRARLVVRQPEGAPHGWLGLFLGEEMVGSMRIEAHRGNAAVKSVSIDPRFRGLGLGRKLYGEAMRQQPGRQLASDAAVTDEARRVWESMSRDPKYSITKATGAHSSPLTLRHAYSPSTGVPPLSPAQATDSGDSLYVGRLLGGHTKVAGAQEDLHPGDVVLMTFGREWERPDGSRPSGAFAAARGAYRTMSPKLQGTFGHAALYVGDGQVVEALSTGVVKRSLARSTRDKAYMVMRPALALSTRTKAAEFATQQVGKPYDGKGAFAAGLGLFLPAPLARGLGVLATGAPRDPASQDAFQCAALVRSAYASAGVKGDAQVPWRTTTPAHLLVARKATIVRQNLKGRDLVDASPRWSSLAGEIQAAHGRLRRTSSKET